MLTVNQPHFLTQSSDISELMNTWRSALDLRVEAGEMSKNTALAYGRGASRFVSRCGSSGASDVNLDTFRTWKASLLKNG